MILQKLDRQIFELAIPALGALLISPVLMLTDSAIVGHWSTPALAGLGLAQVVLGTVVGLCIFLAYTTTATVAQAIGAGNRKAGLAAGMDALWLGVFLGLIAGALTAATADLILAPFHATPEVASQAALYLRITAFGLPGILTTQAATGVIRGLQDTRTPLLVTAAAAVVNLPASLLLTHVARWGIAGAAAATLVCELTMGAVLAYLVARKARQLGIGLRPQLSGVGRAWRAGLGLLVRTLSLRIALIFLSLAALRLGTAQLAAHQIVWNIWSLLANALDALAIAAQALVGKAYGAKDYAQISKLTSRGLYWSFWSGVVLAVIVLASSIVAPQLFSPDPAVQTGVRWALLVVLLGQPLAGIVYQLDGVLMGINDAKFLAKLMLFNTATFLPVLYLLHLFGPGSDAGLVALWLAWTFFFSGTRAAGLIWRVRQHGWWGSGQKQNQN